jgi:hypothetical protein
MSMDIDQFNRDWLQAWTDKDTQRLLSFYHPDIVYKDPQAPMGLNGHEALGKYLDGLFGNTPPMRYDPEEVWAFDGGYCGRWYCTMGQPGLTTRFRGFDLCVLKAEKIILNEVYTHNLPG